VYDNILDIIKNGYKIPFLQLIASLQKNKSALLHNEFVENAISELLVDGLIEECCYIPYIVNPLIVSVQSKGKKILILDLKCVNLPILKQRVK
jgi:predicted house-cleaning noncanonical NTP pyrophosphatase (MazG superfamily)